MAELIRGIPDVGVPLLVDIGRHWDGELASRRLFGVHQTSEHADLALRRAVVWAREHEEVIDVGVAMLAIASDLDAAGTLELCSSTGLAAESVYGWLSARLGRPLDMASELRQQDLSNLESGLAATELFASVVDLAQDSASGEYLAELGVSRTTLCAVLSPDDAADAAPVDIRARGRDRLFDGSSDRLGDGVLAELAMDSIGVRRCLDRMGTSPELLAVTLILLGEKPLESDLKRADAAVLLGGFTMVAAVIIIGVEAWNGPPWLWAFVPLSWLGYPQNRLWVSFASALVVGIAVPWAGVILLLDACSDWLMSRWQQSGLLALTGIRTSERDRRMLDRTAGSASARLRRLADVWWRTTRGTIPEVWDDAGEDSAEPAPDGTARRRRRHPAVVLGTGVYYLSLLAGLLVFGMALVDRDWSLAAMGAGVLIVRKRLVLESIAGVVASVLGGPNLGLVALGHVLGQLLINAGVDLALVRPGDRSALEQAVLPLLDDLPPATTLNLNTETGAGIDDHFDGPVICDGRVTWCAAEALVLAQQFRTEIAPDMSVPALAAEIGTVLPMSASSILSERPASSGPVDRDTLFHVLMSHDQQGALGDIPRRAMVLSKWRTSTPDDTVESMMFWGFGGWPYALLPSLGVLAVEKWRVGRS